MTDVSAQAFREAAAQLDSITPRAYSDIIALLLAAAEQREQLDRMERYERTHLGNLDDLREQVATLTAERETLEIKLAACSVAAIQNTDATIKDRIAPGHAYYSASYGDVCRAVDREMAHRDALATAQREAVEQFVTAVKDRFRALKRSETPTHDDLFEMCLWAINAELARIREDR